MSDKIKSKTTKFFKTLPFNIKEVDEDGEEAGIISGYAAVFNNVDSYGDKILPGAFKKTLKETKGKIPILADHSSYQPIGVNQKAREDETGLFVQGRIDIKNNAVAKERFSFAKMCKEEGMKCGLSIGYFLQDYTTTMEDEVTVYELTKIRLVEYSMVTFPANQEAMVTGLKEENLELAEIKKNIIAFQAKMIQHNIGRALNKLIA